MAASLPLISGRAALVLAGKAACQDEDEEAEEDEVSGERGGEWGR